MAWDYFLIPYLYIYNKTRNTSFRYQQKEKKEFSQQRKWGRRCGFIVVVRVKLVCAVQIDGTTNPVLRWTNGFAESETTAELCGVESTCKYTQGYISKSSKCDITFLLLMFLLKMIMANVLTYGLYDFRGRIVDVLLKSTHGKLTSCTCHRIRIKSFTRLICCERCSLCHAKIHERIGTDGSELQLLHETLKHFSIQSGRCWLTLYYVKNMCQFYKLKILVFESKNYVRFPSFLSARWRRERRRRSETCSQPLHYATGRSPRQ